MVIFTNIINLYDDILINKYQWLITCNRLTPLHPPPQIRTSDWSEGKLNLNHSTISGQSPGTTSLTTFLFIKPQCTTGRSQRQSVKIFRLFQRRQQRSIRVQHAIKLRIRRSQRDRRRERWITSDKPPSCGFNDVATVVNSSVCPKSSSTCSDKSTSTSRSSDTIDPVYGTPHNTGSYDTTIFSSD